MWRTATTIAIAAAAILALRIAKAAESSPFSDDSLTPHYQRAAEFILSQVPPPHKGRVIVFGAGEGRLAHELACRSDYTLVGAEEDEAKVQSGRSKLHAADLYGAQVTLQCESLDAPGYRDYAAALVVSDTMLAEGKCPGSAKELFRMIRPFGGMAVLGQPAGCPHRLQRETLCDWLDAAGVQYEIIETETAGLWAVVRRGPVEGAGEWTHVRGDIANTACSGDTKTTGDFGVLWFGEPGPYIMVDRHWRNISPLFQDGRLIIPAFDRIICSDAYNGARLWDLEIANASRIALMRDAGWLALADGILYAAVGPECLRIDVATGRVIGSFKTPDGKSDWGYLGIDGDRLYGSTQRREASFLAANIGPGAEGNRLGRFDDRPLIVSTSLFCRDARSGELLWTYEPENAVLANVTVCAGQDGLYFVGSDANGAVGVEDGRVPLSVFTEGDGEFIAKVDKVTGKPLWRHRPELPFQHVMHLACGEGIVLASGCRTHEDDYWYHLRAYNASDGLPAWKQDLPTRFGTRDKEHGKQDKHPMLVGGTVYLKQGSFDLATGKPLGYTFQTSNCAECSASAVNLFGRMGGVASTWDLAGDGSAKPLSTAMRPGCYTTIIPAGGIVMMPPFSAGCTCAHTIQTTIAWLPKE